MTDIEVWYEVPPIHPYIHTSIHSYIHTFIHSYTLRITSAVVRFVYQQKWFGIGTGSFGFSNTGFKVRFDNDSIRLLLGPLGLVDIRL